MGREWDAAPNVISLSRSRHHPPESIRNALSRDMTHNVYRKVHQSACRVLSYRIMRRIGASINHVNCIFERGTETFVPKHTEFVSAKLPCNLTRTIINPVSYPT